MKVTGIISALIFAHVAMGQASDSTSSAASTASVSGTKSGASATKTGTKSASASSSSVPDATPTGSTGSTSLTGPLTESSTDELIPAGISDTCSTFLTSLSSDTAIASCFTSLITTLSSFTSGSGSFTAASKALSTLCSSNSCSSTTMRSKLTDWKDACSAELSSNDNMVAKQYDVWYSLFPFKSAICTKDDTTQNYCLLNAAASSSNSSNTRRSDVSYAASHLTKRAQTVLMPNADTYRSSNLMYLFTSPDWPQEQLCTSCTSKIIANYITFEYAIPPAGGVPNSPLLKGQSELWSAMQAKCPTTFIDGIMNAAGASPDQLAGGAVTTTASYFTALAAAFAAAFALF